MTAQELLNKYNACLGHIAIKDNADSSFAPAYKTYQSHNITQDEWNATVKQLLDKNSDVNSIWEFVQDLYAFVAEHVFYSENYYTKTEENAKHGTLQGNIDAEAATRESVDSSKVDKINNDTSKVQVYAVGEHNSWRAGWGLSQTATDGDIAARTNDGRLLAKQGSTPTDDELITSKYLGEHFVTLASFAELSESVATLYASKQDKVDGSVVAADEGVVLTTSYNNLIDLPQIAGVTLYGNKTLEQLGIQSASSLDADVANAGYSKIECNPEDTATVLLSKIKVGTTVYSIPQGGGGGGTSDYTELSNKPQIGGVELSGNKSLSDLGIQGSSSLDTDVSALGYVKTAPTVVKLAVGTLTSYAAKSIATLVSEGYTHVRLTGYSQHADKHQRSWTVKLSDLETAGNAVEIQECITGWQDALSIYTFNDSGYIAWNGGTDHIIYVILVEGIK